MLQALADKLQYRLSLPLPGREAQLRMAHSERRANMLHYKVPEGARKGAVLILFFEEDFRVKLPLILRSEYKGVHSGQVALPGGKFEEEDVTLQQTALREAEEEIGISRHDVELIGSLTEVYIPPSNFLVHPFIGISQTVPSFIPHETEVKEIFAIDLETLLDDSIVSEKELTLSTGLKVVTPLFSILDYDVWGATAMILSELKMVLREIESA
jgi:8-oxo-dGTP pyrophosphatase MutT (NUDIX family)